MDGPVQLAEGVGGTGTTAAWDGQSSFVKFPMATGAAALTFTVGNATLPGTTIVLTQSGAGTTAVTIQPTSTIYNDTAIDVCTINAAGESVTMFWNGTGWAYIGSTETVAIA